MPPTISTSRQTRLLLVLALIIPCLYACERPTPPFRCADSLGCVHIEPGQPIRIGIIQELIGEVAPLGVEQVRGIQLAVDDHQGTILGRPVAMQMEEGGCSGEGGANAAMKILADPHAVAILGTTCSGSARTASAAMSEAGLTMISGNNSAPYLTSIGSRPAPDYHPGYFRTAPNEEYSGRAAATFAFQKLGIRKAATLNDGDIYTTGLTDGFSQEFRTLGGEIVLNASINKGDIQMFPVLSAVENSGAQLLFFPLFQPEGKHILLQARLLPGFDSIILMGDGALIHKSFLDTVKEKGKGMYFIGPSFPHNDATAALVQKYQAKFTVFPGTNYFLSAYDSANLLFQAIEKSALQERDGTLQIGRQALRSALAATAGFQGVTGILTCHSYGDCASPTFNVLRLDHPADGIQGLQRNVIFSYSPDN